LQNSKKRKRLTGHSKKKLIETIIIVIVIITSTVKDPMDRVGHELGLHQKLINEELARVIEQVN